MRVCPACKTENPSKSKFCSHCGKMLVDKADLSAEEKLEIELQKARDENELLKMTLKNSLHKKDEQEGMETVAGDAGSVKEEEDLSHEIANDTESVIESEQEVDAPAETAPSEKQPQASVNPRHRWPKIVALFIVLLMLGGGAVYFILHSGKEDVYYVYATDVMMRSSPEANRGNGNIITTLPYGSLFRVTDDQVYSDGKHIFYYGSDSAGTYAGYVAKDYLMPQEDFRFLDDIFGNENARNLIGRGINRKGCGETRYKRALLQYFGDELGKNANKWKIYCRNPEWVTNSVFYGDYANDSNEIEFAVVIKNVNTNERRLLCFDFDENENVSSFGVLNAPEAGYLKSVYWISKDDAICLCSKYCN